MEVPLDLDPEEFAEWRKAGRTLVLVDCREPWEHAICALPDSTLLPLGTLGERAGELPEDASVVVYCHHGVRSRRGAMILRQLGFKDARSLAGGIDLWSEVIDPTVPRY